MKVIGLLHHFYASNMLVDGEMISQYCIISVYRLDRHLLFTVYVTIFMAYIRR